MSILLDNLHLIIILFFLLCCSAFFSGTETALFSLTRIQIIDFETEKRKSSKIIHELMRNPAELLVAILFGNLTVNILFFCLSTIINTEIGKKYGSFFQVIFGLVVLFTVIICGEIMPKAAGLKFSESYSRCACYPIMFWVRVSKPFRKFICYIIAKIFPLKNSVKKFAEEKELKLLLEVSEEKGAICNQTSDMIEDIIAMISIKAKHIMVPRVDFIQCSAETRIQTAIDRAKVNDIYLMPVYQKIKSEIIGYLDIKKICLTQYRKTDKTKNFINEAVFVPETKIVADLLNEMLEHEIKIVFVVDEYGDIAGLITREVLFKEITGELNIERDAANIPLITKLNENSYRLRAGLSIFEIKDLFIEAFELAKRYNVSSLGGFVVSMLGRNPKERDVVRFKNLQFEVEKVRQNRIISIVLTINEREKLQ